MAHRVIWSRIVATCLAIAAVAYYFSAITDEHFPSLANYSEILPIEESRLKTGDIIFRRGAGVISESVYFLDKKAPYSHVGIVFIDNSGPRVIHSVPDSQFFKANQIRFEPLRDFLLEPGTTEISVKRLANDPTHLSALKAAETAAKFAHNQVGFDGLFDLDTKNEMYCTELVWRAYLEAQVDLVEGAFDFVEAPFITKKVIFTSSLFESPLLNHVLSFSYPSGEKL